MATRKKLMASVSDVVAAQDVVAAPVAAPVQDEVAAPVAAPLVRFSLGAAEVAAADAWRKATDDEVVSAEAVYDLLFKAHGVTVAALLPRKTDDPARSNEEAAQFDFAKRFHAVWRCGADVAAKLFDANVKGSVVLQRAGISRKTGKAYKPQTKRQLTTSIYNTDDWGAFVKRMAAIDEARGIAAKVEAGEMTEAEADEAGKRGASSKKTDLKQFQDRMTDVIKGLRKDPEKQDGSISPDVMSKLAVAFADIMKANGV
jgi:hypothetical protein